jgi:ABC-type multidrug transport system ATPase subunit/pSer/pThr/pTyr-binding forkhead associated (FHA) protein
VGMQTSYTLFMQEGPTPGETFELTKSRIILGRDTSPDIDIIIPSATVSRKHACISQTDDHWVIEDLGSSNGTFLNSVRLEQDPKPLKVGDQIRLGGSVALILQSSTLPEPKQSEAPVGATVLADEVELPLPTVPPKIIITVAGLEPESYTLKKETITVGRVPENDIVIDSQIVSRFHAQIKQAHGGYQLVVLPSASNPVLFEGRPLTAPHRLAHGDVLRIGSLDPGLMVTMTYDSPSEAAEEAPVHVQFGEKTALQFGRDPQNDVVLDTPIVSRFHAQIERIGQRYRIRDLNSSNGTFVNEQRIDQEIWLKPEDTIRIGQHRFVMGVDELAQFDETAGLRADAINLQKWVQKNLNILQDISVVFKPREFIVIVGQSGGGKSTLLDAISGYRPATHGQVLINDVDAYKNFDAIRNNIGYVPQRDIIHMELTVYQAMDYAARLRMPPDTTSKERHRRIMEVLDDLDLTHRKDVQVSGLSGGQQKRVSIGVELITEPGLFFLDEATSGLDPGTETSLMQLLRRLADQGRTIVLVTHATKNVMLADKVIFLARGGYLTWFGPPDEALEYFNQYRTEHERRTSSMEFDKIYSILENPSLGTPEEWDHRFREHTAYYNHILQPLQEKQHAVSGRSKTPATPVRRTPKPKSRPQVSALRQFLILSSRNIKILTRDKVSLVLMLFAAPFAGLLDLLIGSASGREAFDFYKGSPETILTSFFIVIIFSMFIGSLSQMREIVKEDQVYRRERLVNLKILPYVLSKVWVAGLLSLYHAFAYVGIHYLAFEMPGGTLEFVLMYVTMVFLVFSGMMLGLFASAWSSNANTVPMFVILLIMPNIVLSGALVTLPGPVTAPASTRWAFEAFMSITGVGSDVAADLCWKLPKEIRSAMTIDEATERCNCMGTNVVKKEFCNFPGLGKFYNEDIDKPKPEEPPPLREQPAEPVIPPAPAEPDDQSDSVAMAQYFEDLQAYQDEVNAIQDQYKADMEAFQNEAEIYKAEMTAYQEDLIEWQITRTSAVEPAVGMIETYKVDYYWTFVDKNDPQAFWTKIITTWAAQCIIISVLILGVLLMVKRKDVV